VAVSIVAVAIFQCCLITGEVQSRSRKIKVCAGLVSPANVASATWATPTRSRWNETQQLTVQMTQEAPAKVGTTWPHKGKITVSVTTWNCRIIGLHIQQMLF